MYNRFVALSSACFRAANKLARLVSGSAGNSRPGRKQSFRLGEGLVDLCGILAAAPRVIRSSAALAADDWGNLLDQFSGLNFSGESRRYRGNESDGISIGSHEKNDPFEHSFQSVDDSLQHIAISLSQVGDDRWDSFEELRLGGEFPGPTGRVALGGCLERFLEFFLAIQKGVQLLLDLNDRAVELRGQAFQALFFPEGCLV